MAFQSFDRLTEPWWEQQPEESPTAYARFAAYRDQPKGERSFEKVIESITKKVTYKSLKNQSSAHRWRDRIAAYDQSQLEKHRDRIADRSERLAESQISAAAEMLLAARKSVRYVIDNGIILEPEQAAKWADAAIKLGKAAADAPREVLRLTQHAEATGDVATVELDIPELANLGPNEARERLTEMVTSVSRLDDYRKRQDRSA